MLPARIVTAAVLLCALLGAMFWLERWTFAIVVGIVVAIAGHEWAGLAGITGRPRLLYAAGCATLFGAFAIAWLHGADPDWLFLAGAAFWLFAAPAWMRAGVRRSARRWLPPTGLLVILPAAGAMLVLPPAALLVVLALTWIADTAAYFGGRRWGRRKLAPGISPGKTVEGAAVALVAVTIYAIICAWAVPAFRPGAGAAARAALIAGALVLAVAGIVGDLFESAVKRQAGVKDSGTLLPGHGGVLDRIDSATSTLPLAALMFHGMLLP